MKILSAARRTTPRGPSSAGLLLAVLCAADFLVVLDGLIVAVALPTMQRALGIAPASLQWVVNAYVLCFGGFLLLGGRLSDLYGRRRVLILGLVVFAAGALAAGLAWSVPVLVAGRAVQGLGAGLMAPAALALLVATFAEGAARNRALGFWSAAGSIGIPAGALLGGVLTASLGWRWVLLVNVPAALLAAVGTVWCVPESADGAAPRRLDIPGAALSVGGIALVIFSITRIERATASAVLAPLAAGVLLLVAFVIVEHRAPAPLVPLPVLRAPGLLSANLVGATLPVGLGALLFLATLYLQRVLGLGALQTGLAYLALALPVIAASPAASGLVARLGPRVVAVLGLLLQAGGLALLARVPVHGAVATDVLPGFLLVGIGAPLAFIPTTAAAMASAGTRSGLVSGVFNTAQQLGNAVALAAVATLAAARTDALLDQGTSEPSALSHGYAAGFLLAAGIAFAGAAAALRLPRTDEVMIASGRAGSLEIT
ncbi:MAG TPA: MFS transporter [Mycobacteriales bacterium]